MKIYKSVVKPLSPGVNHSMTTKIY